MTDLPLDQPARTTIADDLDRTLFVEAGAGSGKSTALVGRVLELVTTGTARLAEIAAITFTEKAAAELRDRIRQQLERRAADAGAAGDPTVVERCERAIDELDGAAIGTLHAFAQRILAEHPIEVALPPRIEILDEVASEVAFEARWAAYLDDLLTDEDMERTLLLLFATGVKPTALRALATEFDRNWDLVAARVPEDAPAPPPLAGPLAPVLARVDEICSRVRDCTDGADRLAGRLGEVASFTAALREVHDDLDLLDELRGEGALDVPSFKAGSLGAKKNWTCDHKAIQADLRAAGDDLDAVLGDVAQACAHHLAAALRRFTLAGAEERRRAGELAFHDLLVLARSLVSDHPDARERLHRRYRHLLLDEFQDTDPIQIEIAVRIAAEDPTSEEAGTLPWAQVPVRPGHLFFVGDPKQSIYRFRRADISLFLEAAHRYGEVGELVHLSTNFRTGAPIIDWVNHAFDALLSEVPDTDVPVPSQPAYVPLHARRDAPPQPEGGPPVAVVGRTEAPQETGAADLRTAEAVQVAAAIARIRAEGWLVDDGRDPDTDDQRWRTAQLGDITVLVPARTSLPFLEDALDDAGIAYRAEASSLVYASRAVRDLVMALRAIDDPTDHLAVVAALRSPMFACGDDDLFRHKVLQRGHWSHHAPQPDTVEAGPVADALAYLGDLHRARHWVSPAELAEQVARDRRLFELGFADGRTRDTWRRLRFVIDQAREWGEATDGTLRQYLQWVARQSAEGARVAEAVLPESDDDAVRIMTIHAAKGLEFPIAVVSGMTTAPRAAFSPAQVAFPPVAADGSGGGVGYKFGKHVTTQTFEDFVPVDEQMAYDERVRLLYVACTRAKDHLVLSLHRKARSGDPRPSARTNAELLVAGTGTERLDQLPDAVAADAQAPPAPTPTAPEAPAPYAEWRAELDAALASGSRPTTVAATALTSEGEPDVARDEPEAVEPPEPAEAGLHKRPRDLDLPPWLKGRYGTAVGRAVHGVLQTVDLATAAGLAGAVAAQCEAEAIVGREREVEALAREALASPAVAAAASGDHWREVYACTPTAGERLLEGYIDLLHRGPDGFVVIDYKTAATTDAAELDRRTAGYRLQGAAYALAVAATTGEPVARVVFVYLTPTGAFERELTDLPTAIAEVETLVAAGDEHVAS